MPDVKKLNGYYQVLKTIGLRKDFQFQITVDRIEDGIESAGSGETMTFTFFAQASTVPGFTQGVNETQYHGMTFRSPANITFESPWSITVRCDADMKIRDAVEAWIKESADLEKGGGGNKKIPQYNAKVDLLDDELEKINKTYILEGVFPESLGELTIDHASTEISTFDLSIAYQYWYAANEESGQGEDPLQKIDTV